MTVINKIKVSATVPTHDILFQYSSIIPCVTANIYEQCHNSVLSYDWISFFNVDIIILVREIIVFNSTSIHTTLSVILVAIFCVCCSDFGGVTDQCTWPLYMELFSSMSLYEFSSLLLYVLPRPQWWQWLIVVIGGSKDATMKSDLHQRGKNIVRHTITIIFCLITNWITKEAATGL